MVLKACTKCGEAKALDAFSRNKNAKDGLQSQCKACNRSYYEQNAERVIARVLAATDPEAARAKAREWYAANQDRAKARQAEWRAVNKDVKAEATTKWTDANRGKVRASNRKWQNANPEHVRAKTRERRARVRGADGKHTAADVRSLLKTQRCKCAVCRADLAGGYHVDHVMPLVLGGSNDRTNLQLLCRTCNTSKGGKHPVDFMQKRGFLL
jgi:5-methylcytosine-specific restriction endonuclease McrA